MRFYKVAVRAQLVRARFVLGLAQGREHNNFNVFKALGITQNVKHLKAANAGHHYVRNNEIGVLFFGDHQSLFAIFGTGDFVPFGLQTSFIYLAQVIVVFDQQNLRHGSL